MDNHNIKLVFDIGFNQGNFSRAVLNEYPDAKIIGVEGHPMYHESFKGSSNITLIEGVVSITDEKQVDFYICDSNPGINSINPDWINTIRHKHFFTNTCRKIQVKSYSLDTLINDYGVPDLIKLDIEGAEYKSLCGLNQKIPVITFEWCEEMFYDAELCIARLINLGFKKFAYTEQNDIFQLTHNYVSYNDLNFGDIKPERKERWGMIYAR